MKNYSQNHSGLRLLTWLCVGLVVALLLGCEGSNEMSATSDPAVTGTTNNDTQILPSPAPEGARFTPALTWEQSLALPKIWGLGWASTREWDNEVVYWDRMTLVPPLKPEYQALTDRFLQRAAEGKAEFMTGACWPNAVPRSIWYSYPPVFLFPPGNSMLIHTFGETREIWMDGRGHPAEPDTSDPAIAYLGHSVGWWEGDTLVIDTVGFAPYNELYYDVPNGGGMHVVERYSLITPLILGLELTIYSDRLLEPWVINRKYYGASSVPGVTEAILRGRDPTSIETTTCRPADSRESIDSEGNSYVDLTPPPQGLGIGSDEE